MLIKIGNFDCTECWDGVFYKKLSDYPHITEWEIQTILDFIEYEKSYNRPCEIEAKSSILDAIENYKELYKEGIRVNVPEKITECTACPKYKGCMTDYVCHTAPIENAIKILDCGSLLSPVKARNISACELKAESRNAANDPEDFFLYIMFAWGNCQAGDRLVMERKLGRFPDETDLSTNFTPGVRFFFKYDTIIKHPAATFEGVLPLKIKDEVILKDWVYSIIIPEMYREIMTPHIPATLKDKVHFIENDCKDIWEWSEKVYEYTAHL
ncbi:MAG: hypothetical protein K6G26_03660 [Lachnospiraceae bacterium]|nr:hypothetical protein [Lachnospiraceae bacterium]